MKKKVEGGLKSNGGLEKLGRDVSEFEIWGSGEKVYLEGIVDMYKNEIVRYGIRRGGDVGFRLEGVNEVVGEVGKVWYGRRIESDEGWEYGERRWGKRVKKKGIMERMWGGGSGLENGVMERLFNKVKVEMGGVNKYS